MYIHELIGTEDKYIFHLSTDIIKVLTPYGAVYDSAETDNPLNFSVACGILFKDDWREATAQEIENFKKEPIDKMFMLVWNPFIPKTKAERCKELGIKV